MFDSNAYQVIWRAANRAKLRAYFRDYYDRERHDINAFRRAEYRRVVNQHPRQYRRAAQPKERTYDFDDQPAGAD